jgi:hypothetical protein
LREESRLVIKRGDTLQSSNFLIYETFFKTYVKRFDSPDEVIQKNIELKRDHTYRVLDHITTIGVHLNLNDQEMLIAKTIALFHDIGRFYQFSHYKTFKDSESENHAKLSVKILETENILNTIPEQEKQLILKAIGYHNTYQLPIEESKTCLMFSQLIRDADKIDIFKVLTDYYSQLESNDNPTLEHHLPNDGTYNSLIIEDILNYRNSNHKMVRTRYDQRLLTLTWIFDINYNISLEMIRKRNYIEKTMKVLPNNEEMAHVQAAINQYFTDREH